MTGVETDALVLIVEDNPMDVRLLTMALTQAGFSQRPKIVNDGIPAIEYLELAKNQPEMLPDLVLLDLNLINLDGPEVLAHIRRSSQLQKLYVAVVSSSPSDIMKMRAAQADAYYSKPDDLDSFLKVGVELRAGLSGRNQT